MERWIISLISRLDEYVDEETKKSILEQCGRRCISPNLIKKASKIYEKVKDDEGFLEKLGEVYPHLHREGKNIYITYPKCYCSFVNKIPPGQLSPTYCNCSRGWVKALFGGALGRQVEVLLEKSIVKGDDHCRFRVLL